MKKKWLIILGALMMLTSLSTVALADRPVQLLVNGWLVNADVPPQLVEGRVMVPVRWVAEALGAKVDWYEESGTVNIQSPELSSLQGQVRLLERALAPATPGEAVEKWARGVKERNGALQYAVLSPQLKEQRFAVYQSCSWVTGTSSPWVERYEIVKETRAGDASWAYEVRYTLATSTGPAGSGVEKLVVKQLDNHWYIDGINDEKGFSLVLPAGWSKKFDGMPEIVFLNKKGEERGGFGHVGYYSDQPVTSSLPNHSQVLGTEDVETPLGKGKMFLLERDQPAASGNNQKWREVHAIIPLDGKKTAYDFWLKVDGPAEETKLALKQILDQAH